MRRGFSYASQQRKRLALGTAFAVAAISKAFAQDLPLADAQRLLIERGYDPGPADGLMGPRTRAAIEAFQNDNGLVVTGRVDEETGGVLLSAPTTQEVEPHRDSVRETLEDPASTQTVRTQDRLPSDALTPEAVVDARPEQVLPRVPAVQETVLETPIPEGGAVDEAKPGFVETDSATSTFAETQALPPSQPSSDGTTDVEAPAEIVSTLIALGVLLLVPFLIVRWIVRRVRAIRARWSARRSARAASSSPAQSKSSSARAAKVPASYPPRGEHRSSYGQGARARWVAPNDTIHVGGTQIGGLVYVGTPSWARDGRPENWVIDPNLPIAKRGGDLAGDELSYWPSYSETSPRGRATYLEWLASGRRSPDQDAGYIFLYFYGLEHRFFHGASETEHVVIAAEVERLLDVYGGVSGSVRHYLGTFLEAAELVTGRAARQMASRFGDMPLSLKAELGRMARDETPLEAEQLRLWFLVSPETRVRTPAERCRPEFEALFDALFDERHPNGLKIKAAKTRLTATYQAASRTFEVELAPFLGDLPDVTTLKAPLTKAQTIADEAMGALDGFSRLLGRDPQARGTLAAHALLPARLRELFPCEELDAIHAWADDIIANGGSVAASSVVAKTRGDVPDKLSKKLLVETADVLAAAGIGMAPDVRFALRAPKLGEPVILFRPPRGEGLREVSDAYREMTLRLGLAMLVAQADGVVDASEEIVLERMIADASGVSDGERERLRATLRWMAEVPPDLSVLRKRIKDAGEAAQETLALVILRMATADGHVAPEEVEQLERVYKLLGLDPSRLYGELHHAASGVDEPVLVRRGEAGRPDLAIPDEKVEAPARAGIGLDVRRVAEIRSDTSQVSSLLAGIFSGDAEEDEDDGPIEASGDVIARSTIEGLDVQHTAFATDVAAAEHWTQDAIEALAARHGLMTSGAIEQLNEWSFARFERAYLDEYEGYDVDPDVAANILGGRDGTDQEAREGHDRPGAASGGGAQAGTSAHPGGPGA